MTAITFEYNTAVLGSVMGLIGNFARSVARLVMAPFAYARAVNQLEALDDRMLSDIGISRGDIRHMVAHGRR